MMRSSRYARALRLASAILAILCCLPAFSTARAATRPEPKPAKSPARKATLGSALGGANFAGAAGVDLPHYEEPPAYAVDLVIHSSDGTDMVMHRFVDQGRTRTDINAQGQDISMIEMGDASGTSITLMPKEKRAIKQSSAVMEKLTAQVAKKPAEQEPEASPAEVKIENLGDVTLDGKVVKKVRMSVPSGSALGWFDKATGAPVKMESTVEGKTSSIEWQNMKVGPQPAKLYEVPKNFEVTDMDEMMAKMKSAGGMPGMGALAGMAGRSGMPGMGGMPGIGGGLSGMAGGMGQNFGSQLGGKLGTTLGASLGGPLGAIAGHYIGGKIGGMVGRKAVDAVIPGK